MKSKILIYSLLLLFAQCSSAPEQSAGPVFELLSPEATGLHFENKVEEKEDFNIISYRNFYNGAGVAVGDINNDGLPDIYFCSNQQKNKLYLNKGGLRFEDITDKAGVAGTKSWSTGVTMADVNADGYLDIYVCNSGDIKGDNKENELFINNKNGSFTEKAKEYNLNNQGYSTHASFFDYDRDGDLDCYILNNSFKNPDRIELYKSMRDTPDLLGGDKLMRNDSEQINGVFKPKFTDVTSQAGIYSSAIGFGLGIATGDVNSDGWPDLYISNDFFEKDYLYINNKNGTFTEELNQRLDYCSTSSMGGDIGDLNGDGYPEIFTTDMLPASNHRIKRMVVFEPYHLEDYKYRANYYYQFIQNCLHLNNGQGQFKEIAHLASVAATDWSWGAMIFDFQNDGYNDIFVANGISKDLMEGDFRDFVYNDKLKGSLGKDKLSISEQLPTNPIENFAFVNHGNLSFENKAIALGLKEKTFSNGSAYADLDNDGDLELVLNNVNQPAMIYQNLSNSNEQHYLKLQLQGPPKNPKGIGAKAIIMANERVFVKENFTNRGFQSSIEPQLLFGLGAATQVDLQLIWPDGKVFEQKNIKVNQTLKINYNAAGISTAEQKTPLRQLAPIPHAKLAKGAYHVENSYNDFDQEPLLLSKLSAEGPKIVKADYNADGLDDFVLLGARNDPDKMFLQSKSGNFQQVNQAVFEKDKAFESSCGAVVDFDNDGDADLLLGSGGNEVGLDKLQYIVRLYINDGKGNMQVSPAHIPPIIGNFSSILVSDLQKDGSPEVFFGGRCIPGSYGLRPESYLLKIENQNWVDISPASFKNLGMITAGTWQDIDNDHFDDLVLVGDWSPIMIFKNNKGIIDRPSSIASSSGWWQSIAADDLDSDGDVDFVVGNWGKNTKLQASSAQPLSMQVGDFDSNGKSEFIINWYAPADTQAFPFAGKMELTAQMPGLKSKNLKYAAFADMKFPDLFPDFPKENLLEYEAEELQSGLLINDKGTLTFKALNIDAQMGPVKAIAIADFDADGTRDIILAGNNYELKPQIGRQNAMSGLFLKGQQNHRYIPQPIINFEGEVRDFSIIGNKLLVGRNNNHMLFYSLPFAKSTL